MAWLRRVGGIVVDCGCARSVAVAYDGEVNVAAGFIDCEAIGGKLDQRGSRGCRRLQRAKQSVLFISGAGREIECSRIAAVAAVAKDKPPQFVDLDAYACFVLKRTQESPRTGAKGINTGTAFAESANQQRVAEDAESGGSDNGAPGRIKRSVIDRKHQIAHTVSIKLSYEAVAETRHLVARHGIHLGIHDIERAAEILNVERVIGVTHCGRDGGIDEAAGDSCWRVGAVEYSDTVGEVGRVETVAARVAADRKARVNVSGLCE